MLEEVEEERAARRLFLFSSNFLGGAERKVPLNGISTLYRSAYLAQLVNARDFFQSSLLLLKLRITMIMIVIAYIIQYH